MSDGMDMVRVPPNDVEAERSLLGAMMLTPKRIPDVACFLQEADFYRRDHGLIYRAVIELNDRNVHCDSVTLTDWFESNGLLDRLPNNAYLYEMANDTGSAANLVAYAEIVQEKARLRSLIDIGTRLAEQAWSGHAAARDIVATANHELGQLPTDEARQGLQPAKPILAELIKQREERLAAGPGSGLLGQPTPWLDLNKRLRGLRDGNVYVIAGRPSMGKSVMGVQLATFSAMRGNNTALFSVEMTGEECLTRAVACAGEIAYEWVEDPYAPVDADMKDVYEARHARAYEALLQAKLQVDATPGLTVTQWVARARRAHRRDPIRLIVLDHMHDMKINPDRARFEYGDIIQAGKTMAKEFKCPVVILGQLNRGAKDRSEKRPVMSDLRESGEIEQKADVIIFLHREDYYDKKTSLVGTIEAIIAKGRNVRPGTVYLENRFDEMRINDWVGPIPVDDKPESGGRGGRKGFHR